MKIFSDRDLFISSDSICICTFMDVIKALNLNLDAQGLSLKLFTRNPRSLKFFNSRLRMTQMNRNDQKIVRRPSVLHGLHSIRFPFMALNTQRQLKFKRHVIAQRVIAGTMTIEAIYDPNQPISENDFS